MCGTVLTQETESKEHIKIITYMSRRFLDAETRYIFIKFMLIVVLCIKLRHYLLSTCIVLPPPPQIVGRFAFSKFIDFTMDLHIIHI